MRTFLDNTARLFYYLWFSFPYLLLLTVGVCVAATEILLGGMSWQNDAYSVFFPIVLTLVPVLAGLLLLPFITLYVLLFKRCYTRHLLNASIGYLLCFILIIVAGNMGWWVD